MLTRKDLREMLDGYDTAIIEAIIAYVDAMENGKLTEDDVFEHRNNIHNFIDANRDKISEVVTVLNEINEYTDLLTYDEVYEHIVDFAKDEIPSQYHMYMDWEHFVNDVISDYSVIEFQGAEYYYRD